MSAASSLAKRFDPAEIESSVAAKLVQPLPAKAYDLLAQYLDLLYRWNQRMNLTAVRDPRILMKLHLAECLLAAQQIPADVESVLDFGSGTGLPGIPIQIVRPNLRVTLAESQKKKAAFLQEALRTLDLSQASVHAGRVEDLPVGQTFDLVTLRAVDRMQEALASAATRIRPPQRARKGWCLVLSTHAAAEAIQARLFAPESPTIDWQPSQSVPATDQRVLLCGYRSR